VYANRDKMHYMSKSQYIKLIIFLPMLPCITFIDISECCSHVQL